ncbi:unnamed protein product [Auanema sp. JU1783]|nr:unnamed protein product [Auanema sp. JU1783]
MKRRKSNLFSAFTSMTCSDVLVVLFLIISFSPTVSTFEEFRCGTTDIRNSPKHRLHNLNKFGLDAFVNCTVLEGSFLMSMVLENTSDIGEWPRYEKLREITGSLLIFQVKGLKTLRWIFPNLRIIGGQSMIQHYSLIIYQNEDIEEIGLDELRIVRNGGVRIADNPKLCNAKSIDWRRIQAGPINDLLVDDSTMEVGVGEGKIAPCEPTCTHPKYPDKCHFLNHPSRPMACFGKKACQLYCEHDRIETANGTSLGPGCVDGTNEKCHEECVAGCTKANDPGACYGCAHISHAGKCVRSCPKNLFSYMDRRCISRKTCEMLNPRSSQGKIEYYKATSGKCDIRCPEGYEEEPENRHKCRLCAGECHRICGGNGTIDSLSKAKLFAGCSIIDGYLEIELRTGMEFVPAEELTKCFQSIQVIQGYLLIRHSPVFVNLNMFKNLTTITGSFLYREKYALAVFENPNLAKLFASEKNLTIERGYLQFHNNRMLCFRHITELMERMNRIKEMDESDQSKTSNGDKAICDESSFDVYVDSVSYNSFGLKWRPYNTFDIDFRKFLGYEILYKEVTSNNTAITVDDDRSACSDSWMRYFQEVTSVVSPDGYVLSATSDRKDSLTQSDVSALLNDYANGTQDSDYNGPHVDVLITADVKPDTTYAFYVTTVLVRHIGARNAVSPLGFVRTTFGIPDPPQIIKAEALGTDSISIEWSPPRKPNGQVTHYTINYRPIDVNLEKKASVVCSNENVKDLSDDRSFSRDSSYHVSYGFGTSLVSTTAAPETCAAKNCCPCQTDVLSKINELENNLEFENSMQNIMFVQRDGAQEEPDDSKRMKRSISTNLGSDKDNLDERRRRIESYNEKIEQYESLSMPNRINVTGNKVILRNLKHYTEYFVSIVACQNVSVPDSHCSHRKAWHYIRTDKIPDADVIDNSTINVEFVGNSTNDFVVNWKPPKYPNGAILAYKVRVTNLAQQATPIEQCNSSLELPNPEKDGVPFNGLADGHYRVEIRTVSELGISAAAVRSEPVIVERPSFWTVRRIIYVIICIAFFLSFLAACAYFCMRKYYGEKVKEYATQLISANPEYLSQNDVYKADHWELQRERLQIYGEIGRGTFGKVYRGRGLDVVSVCGETFGECAIKTVAENACSAERLHFLLEASIMKQFNASYIVKLYGVVSDGQPVLVVMEMMEKGNLRDYLRSRRPGDEANIDNLPVPTEDEYYEWAAQIADGMAYLESIRFCHRDLAARNCMVHSDLTVKIGDFGMARDLYYHEYYKPTGKRLMPVRWMAPESLKDGKFDTKSDVWSYGIVLYEMITLGQQPYQGLGNHEVLSFIGMSRQVMDAPKDCPVFWYKLMLECWKYSPRERPSFHQIVRHLSDRVSDKFLQESYVENFATEFSDGPILGLESGDDQCLGSGDENCCNPLADMEMDRLTPPAPNKRSTTADFAWGEDVGLASNPDVAEDEV